MGQGVEMEQRSLQEQIKTAVSMMQQGGELTAQAARRLNTLVDAAAAESIDFCQVCNHLYDGIHVTDGTGRIIFINEGYTRTTGIQPEELLGRLVSEVEAEGVLYTGSVTDRVLEQRKRVNSVATIRRLNKEVLVTGTPVFDEHGEIQMVVTNTRDFPELKRLEAQLLALEEKQEKANQELAYLRSQQAGGKQTIYRSRAMQEVMEVVRTVAPTDVTVLITGESGTGKELIANEIYQNSSRRGKPFIKLNCAAIPAELLESELFGYEEGAFTGARRTGKAGMFELANTGVLLLDEIGDMPLALQPKLLRVLQQRSLVRLGGSKPIALDIRVIASTNKDLLTEVRQGRFREDLYYRLSVVPIELKRLRERRDDIPLLANHFCDVFRRKYGKEVSLAPEAMAQLIEYSWPGNIRELENLVERLVVTSHSGEISGTQVSSALNLTAAAAPEAGHEGASLKAQVQAFEREVIVRALKQEGSLRKAALSLGVEHSTLTKKCQRLGVNVGDR